MLVVARLGWRYRHELAPFYTALGLTIVAGIGYDYAQRWWPLALPLGGAAHGSGVALADRPAVGAHLR